MMQIKCMCSTVKCLNKASRFASRDERHLWESYSVLKEKALKSFPPRKQLYFTFPVVYSFSVVLCSISFRAIRSGVMRSGGSKQNSWTCKVNSIKDLATDSCPVGDKHWQDTHAWDFSTQTEWPLCDLASDEGPWTRGVVGSWRHWGHNGSQYKTTECYIF